MHELADFWQLELSLPQNYYILLKWVFCALEHVMFLFSLYVLQVLGKKKIPFALKTEILVNNESYECYNKMHQHFS